MANLVRWNPLQEMMTLRDAMNQLVSESFVRPLSLADAFQPAMDLAENDQEYIVTMSVPGLESDKFEITMQQNMLTIHGQTQSEEKREGTRYHVQERSFGEFTRVIQFPTQVDSENIQANLNNGILTIRVPKAEDAQPKKITVQANQTNGSSQTNQT